MTRRAISKEIIKAIAEGMDDEQLMSKYELSSSQLQGVFERLAKARKSRMAAIAQDIASGMSEAQLAEKYGLSPHGLTNVKGILIAENIISCSAPDVCEVNVDARDKVKVDAKDVLTDVRSGMTDAALREKYGLSAKGLDSLFDKLGELGLIHRLNTHEVLGDLRSGMTDSDLMRKYQLSENAVRNLFAEIERVHLLQHPVEPGEKLDELETRVLAIARDMESDMSKAELMRKFRLTEHGVEWVSSFLAVNEDKAADDNQDMPSNREEPETDAVETPHSTSDYTPHTYQSSFSEAPEIRRDGLVLETFVIVAGLLWLTLSFLNFGLIDVSGIEPTFSVIFCIGGGITLIATCLYLGFRRWLRRRRRMDLEKTF